MALVVRKHGCALRTTSVNGERENVDEGVGGWGEGELASRTLGCGRGRPGSQSTNAGSGGEMTTMMMF